MFKIIFFFCYETESYAPVKNIKIRELKLKYWWKHQVYAQQAICFRQPPRSPQCLRTAGKQLGRTVLRSAVSWRVCYVPVLRVLLYFLLPSTFKIWNSCVRKVCTYLFIYSFIDIHIILWYLFNSLCYKPKLSLFFKLILLIIFLSV